MHMTILSSEGRLVFNCCVRERLELNSFLEFNQSPTSLKIEWLVLPLLTNQMTVSIYSTTVLLDWQEHAACSQRSLDLQAVSILYLRINGAEWCTQDGHLCLMVDLSWWPGVCLHRTASRVNPYPQVQSCFWRCWIVGRLWHLSECTKHPKSFS